MGMVIQWPELSILWLDFIKVITDVGVDGKCYTVMETVKRVAGTGHTMAKTGHTMIITGLTPVGVDEMGHS